MFNDRGIIPKCFNGLDRQRKTIHLYYVNKKKSD